MSITRYLVDGDLWPAERIFRLAAQLRQSPFAKQVILEKHDDALVLELRAVALAEVQPLLEQVEPALELCTEAELLAKLPLLHDKDEADSTSEVPSTVFAGRAALLKLGVLWYGDLRLLDLLRTLFQHPRKEVRAGVIAAANRAGYRFFLLELLTLETDPTLQRILNAATAFAEAESE